MSGADFVEKHTTGLGESSSLAPRVSQHVAPSQVARSDPFLEFVKNRDNKRQGEQAERDRARQQALQERQAAKAWDEGFERDLQSLSTGQFQENQNWRRLASVAIAGVKDDQSPEHNDLGQKILHELRDHPEFRASIGILDKTTSFEDLYIEPKGPGLLKRGFTGAINQLMKPGKWGIGMTSDIADGDYGAAARRLLSGTWELIDETAALGDWATSGALGKLTGVDLSQAVDKATDKLAQDELGEPNDYSHKDIDGDGMVGFREAVGLDPDWGESDAFSVPVGFLSKIPGMGKLGLTEDSRLGPGHILEMGGQMAVDPLSYVTAGGGGIAGRASRDGLDQLELLLAKSAGRGVSILDKAQRAKLQSIVTQLKSGKSWKSAGFGVNERNFVEEMLRIGRTMDFEDVMDAIPETGGLFGSTRKIKKTADAVAHRAGGGTFFANHRIPLTRGAMQKARTPMKGGRALIGSTYEVKEALYKVLKPERVVKIPGSLPEPLALGPGPKIFGELMPGPQLALANPQLALANPGPLKALPAGPQKFFGRLGPGHVAELPVGVIARDVDAVLREVDSYVLRLSDNQRAAVQDQLDAWDPTSEPLRLSGHKGVDAEFSAIEHAYARNPDIALLQPGRADVGDVNRVSPEGQVEPGANWPWASDEGIHLGQAPPKPPNPNLPVPYSHGPLKTPPLPQRRIPNQLQRYEGLSLVPRPVPVKAPKPTSKPTLGGVGPEGSVGSSFRKLEETYEAVEGMHLPLSEIPEGLKAGEMTAGGAYKLIQQGYLTGWRKGAFSKARNGLNTAIKISDRWGDAEAKLARAVSGVQTSTMMNELAEFNSVMTRQHGRALRQVQRNFNLSKKEAHDYLDEILNRIRSFDTLEKRTPVLQEMGINGMKDVKEMIGMLDAYYLKKATAEQIMGTIDEKQLAAWIGNADEGMSSMQHRRVDKRTNDQLNKWKNAGSPEFDFIRKLGSRPPLRVQQYLVDNGWADSLEDAASGISSLFNPWTDDVSTALSTAQRQATDADSSIGSAIAGRKELFGRQLFTDLRSSADVNEAIAGMIREASKDLDVPEGFIWATKFYDTDQVDVAMRTMSGHKQAIIMSDMLNDLADYPMPDMRTGNMVRPVIKGSVTTTKAPTKRGKAQGYYKTYEWDDPVTNERMSKSIAPDDDPALINELGGGTHRIIPLPDGVYIVEHDIAGFLDDVVSRTKGEAFEGPILGLLNEWNTIWAAHATVPLVGTGFHARNTLGNAFNMAMAGVKNPMVLRHAQVLQNLNNSVITHMQKVGILDWEEGIADAIAKNQLKGFSKKEIAQIKMARKNGVLSSSFFSDIKGDAAKFTERRSKGSIANKLVDNKFVSIGQRFGTFIENNARLGMFIDGLDKGMSPMISANRVKKYLFDYSDLTPFENNILRSGSRFYTWMRKNTALQARLLVSQPGSVWNGQRLVDSTMGGLWGSDGNPLEQGLFTPDWAQDNNLMFSADKMMLHGYETPLMSAFDTVSKLAGLAGTIPGGNYLLPEGIGQRTYQENVQSALGLLASGPSSAVTNTYELALGKDLFTQRPISDSGYAKVMQFVEVLLPTVPKLMREMERYRVPEFTGIDIPGFDEAKEGLVSEHQEGIGPTDGVRWLSTFLGAQVYQLNDEQQVRYLAGVTQNYEDLLGELKESGYDPPTLTELVDAGKVGRTNEYLSALYFAKHPSDAMARILPAGLKKEFADELGIPVSILETRDRSEAERMDELFIMQSAFEHLSGKPFTEKQAISLALSMDDRPPNFWLEERGIGGVYESTVFYPEDDTAERDKEYQAFFDRINQAYGLTEETWQEIQPFRDEHSRLWADAREAGMSDIELNMYVIGELGRTRIAALMELGAVDGELEVYDFDKDLSPEELTDIQDRMVWDLSQLDLIMLTHPQIGRRATPEEQRWYLVNGARRMQKGQLDDLVDQGVQGLPEWQTISNLKPYPGYEIGPNAQNVLGALGAAQAGFQGVQIPSGLLPKPTQ